MDILGTWRPFSGSWRGNEPILLNIPHVITIAPHGDSVLLTIAWGERPLLVTKEMSAKDAHDRVTRSGGVWRWVRTEDADGNTIRHDSHVERNGLE